MIQNRIKSHFALITLTLIYIVNFVDRQLVAVIAPVLKQEFVLSNTEIGLIYGSLFSFFYAVFGIPLGHLSDRISRKKLILFCLAIWSISTIAGFWIQSILHLIILRIIVAIAESGASPSAYSLIADLFKKEEVASKISIYASGIFIGIGLAFLLGGSLTEYIGWREAFLFAGTPGLLIVIIALFLIPDIKHTKVEDVERSYDISEGFKIIWLNKALRFHLMGFSFLALSGYALLSFLSTVLTNLGRPDLIKHYGWFMMGVSFMVIISGALADFLAKKSPSRRFIPAIIASCAGLPFYWFGLSQQNGLYALIGIGMGALLASSYNGVAASLIQQLTAKEHRGLAGGVYLFMISIGGFGLGPFITGYLSDHLFLGPDAITNSLKLVLTSCGIIGALCIIKSMKEVKRLELQKN